MTKVVKYIGAIGVWELAWYIRRNNLRQSVHAKAQELAKALGKPLVTVGAPDLGATSSPGGDVIVDIRPSSAPNSIVADVCKRLPFADNSVVVFVSCVLEYVDDYPAAVAELTRISGGNLFVVRVEPWTLTNAFYPGRKRAIPDFPLPMLPAVKP